MNEEIVIAVLAVIVLFLLCALAGAILYFTRREKRFAGNMEDMLEDAVSGEFQEKRLDESRMSVIESDMWRYLCDHERKVSRLAKEREQMQEQISDISHQAVIPISNIVLYSQLLEEWTKMRNPEDRQNIRDALNAIEEQAKTLNFLMESLVKLSRLETGIIRVHARRQPLQTVLEAVRNQFQAIAARKEIRFEAADTDEQAAFDRKWTIEAVANIVDNAIKYTPRGGRVTVRVQSYPSLVRMDISDNGPGIPEEEQAKVFLRFYRSETVSDSPGVGIGLYLAREVMRAQNGYIKLSSKMDEGSTFSLFFMKEEMSQK